MMSVYRVDDGFISVDVWLDNMRKHKNMRERSILNRALKKHFKGMRIYREYVLPKRVEAYEQAAKRTEEEEILDRINHYRIDAVCVDDCGIHHIIEAKVKLNPEAIGQVLVFSELYKRWIRLYDADIKRIIVCEETEEILERLCSIWGIDVLVV